MEIIYVTGNDLKFQIANNVFKQSKIKLIQQKLDTPEIQSDDVCEVAKYSALWALEKLNSSVMVTDAGFYINALNGFPGPFVKYINRWFSTDDILKLLEDKEDRSIYIKDCLVYCSKHGEMKIFEHQLKGVITKKVKSERGSIIDRLVIPESLDRTISELTPEETIEYWGSNSTIIEFKEWIEENK